MNGPRLYATHSDITRIRRQLADHDWYARSFQHLIEPADQLLRHGISIPTEKGYAFYDTCPEDNNPLLQDPFNPRDHRCGTCGRNYTAEPYHRAWVAFYQSYLSQRTVEMGIAYQLTGDDAYADAIRHVLLEYADRYVDYPLEGYVLGPTRLFQSTYVESLWLASLVAAADFVRDTIPAPQWRHIRDDLFLPSAEIILGFDEGDNNRQAMNNVALGFVGLLCDDSSLVDRAVHGPHGWFHHLGHSVQSDGMWYEGENYHFATLPAMLNLAEAMTRNGCDLWAADAQGRRLAMMFDAPLATLHPDLTLPARKDSRYGSPIGQRWQTGMYELGYRRCASPSYAWLLRTVYADPPELQACIPNAAGFIDVLPSRPADRERLDWRGFLAAAADLGEPTEPIDHMVASVNLPGTGLGVLRADAGRTYVSLDYGHYGGGHGHPDRLQLNLYTRGRPWLTDWGTGNYFFDHLQWYRSTLAHNTVAVDGGNHQPVAGRTLEFAATRDDCQLLATEVDDVYPGVRFRRTVVILDVGLTLDIFVIDAAQNHQLDWVIHPLADSDIELSGVTGSSLPAQVAGEGYEWLHDVRRFTAPAGWDVAFRQGADELVVHGAGQPDTEIFTAAAYGPPDRIPHLFPVLFARRRAAHTTFATLFEHRERGIPVVDTFRVESDRPRYHIDLRTGEHLLCSYDVTSATVNITRSRGKPNDA